jgi:hypothetical protein
MQDLARVNRRRPKLVRCLLLASLALSTAFAQVGPPPVIVTQPLSQTVQINDGVTFLVVAASGTRMTYKWFHEGKRIGGANAASYTIPRVSLADAGSYAVRVVNAAGSVMSSNATLTILVPPQITADPANQQVVAGQTASFSVVANGSPPLTFQWLFNGVPLADATNSTLTLNSVQLQDAGAYSAKVSNVAGSVTSAPATLIVDAPPSISTGPQSQTVIAGRDVSFSVVASGTAPLRYQWNLAGASIPGATQPTLTLNNVQPTDAGNYSVVVANVAGSTPSAAATLTVLVPPSITTEPQSQTVIAGQSASFSVVADGTAPLNYQWSFGTTALPGATNAALTLTNVQPADAGDYTVVVANTAGSATSAAATLAVTIPSCTTPPRFDSTTMTSQGFTLQSSVSAGCSYILLTSADLVDWMPLCTNTALAGTLEITDSGATNLDRRFYRVEVE